MDIKESNILKEKVDQHFYYRAKAAKLLAILQGKYFNKVLDIGAGSAYFSKFLLRENIVKEACCVDISYENNSLELYDHKPIQYQKLFRGFSDAQLVLLMDVLEHVEEDARFLSEYVDKSPSGSIFVITVPAFMFLWSSHDIFLGHKRRYSLKQLQEVVSKSGLYIDYCSFYFLFIFPIVALIRFIRKFAIFRDSPTSDLRIYTPLVNRVLEFICNLEKLFIFKNTLMGVSIICLAHKR